MRVPNPFRLFRGRRSSQGERRRAVVHQGDTVRLNSGHKVDTPESPGSTDLRGVACVVTDEPTERVGSVDGKIRERVHVRPILPNGGLGMPLDVPVERISGDSRRRRSFAGMSFGPGGRIIRDDEED